MLITSLQNPRIKSLLKLRTDVRQRRKDGLTLVEGWDEITLALAGGHEPRLIVTADELVRTPLKDAVTEQLHVSAGVFRKLSVRENPDGWLALFAQPSRKLDDLKLGPAPLLVVVEAVEKPGNLGAIFRTCDAAGVEAVIVCDPGTDLFGPNVVRGSRGTVFTVPAVVTGSDEALAFLRSRGIRVVAATPAASRDYMGADLRGPVAIAVGTEDLGLSETWLGNADIEVKIPMRGKVNSLNVSVATALIIYEALRQRAIDT